MSEPIYPTKESLKADGQLTDYGWEIYEILDKVIAQSKEWFEESRTDRDNEVDENYIHGFEIDGYIFDIDIWDGRKISDDNKWHCEIIECYDDGQYHCRGYRDQFLWEAEIGTK